MSRRSFAILAVILLLSPLKMAFAQSDPNAAKAIGGQVVYECEDGVAAARLQAFGVGPLARGVEPDRRGSGQEPSNGAGGALGLSGRSHRRKRDTSNSQPGSLAP
jgi:hypothetical protein